MKADAMYKFVQELKRRRVFRGIVVFGASTLVFFEAATNLVHFLGQVSPPCWFVVLLVVGFFASLLFSRTEKGPLSIEPIFAKDTALKAILKSTS